MPEGKIYKAIVDVMREIGAIGKDATNEAQKFKYRAAEQVYNRSQPLMAKHGIFMVPKVTNHSREVGQTSKGGQMHYSIVTVEYTFFADDGSSVTVTALGEGMDSGDKSCAKAQTAASKTAICQLFSIPYAVVDPDAHTPEWFAKEGNVTLASLNKLKQDWFAANKAELEGKDRNQIKLAFSQWIGETTGEEFRYDDFRDWTPEWLALCQAALKQ